MSFQDYSAWALGVWSVLLAVQSAHSISLSLYAWEDESKRAASRIPEDFEPPKNSFTLLLPAKSEESVIADTIQRMVDLKYPRHLVQILVIIDSSDEGTIAVVSQKLDQLHSAKVNSVQLITFDDEPVTKPHGLNVGLRHASGEVVTIFDAEDEPHPDILNVVNTLMVREGAPVVQCGVQLMNYRDHWFSSLNVLEYFFWFKSRLHFHATRGMIPLGGNTAFMRKDLLERIGGWDDYCLTEDADLGIRISAYGATIRVAHDDRYVTREETPHSIGQFIKQRTRWDQGFLQVLKKGDWRRLPSRRQRTLALYTLAFPMLQALFMLYLPISIYTLFYWEVPILVAMLASLPLYMMLVQLLINIVGLHEFTSAHGLKPSVLTSIKLALVYLPYQWILAFAALRAYIRHLRGVNNWEKTHHTGAHRQTSATG
ncbi:MAG: glycosyltransferase [Actinobacteria bacterium]|nr:glycosyltransferase [Actinomycetota bacterium]